MFRTLKIPIGLVIALTMSVLALSVVIVNKLEHNASVVDVVKGNTATLSNALSLQLLVVMERSPGDNALFSSLFQPIKEHDNLISATLYDNDYQVISTIQPDSLSQLSNQSVPLDPAEIPFGVTQYDNVITAHQIVGSSLYPLGHVVLYVDIEDTMAASSARQLIKQVPIVIAVWLLCTGTCVFILYRLISPIGSLRQFTQEVFESKDYALRSSLNTSNEIGQLSNNINSLLDTIEVELLINFEQKQTLVDQQETMSRLANFDSLTGLPNRQFYSR